MKCTSLPLLDVASSSRCSAARLLSGRSRRARSRASGYGASACSALLPRTIRKAKARMAAFLQELQQLGWVDGRNVRIDARWGAGDTDRIRRYAAELVALAPDVILATSSATVAPLQEATRTVPIVFASVTDPVGAGFVASLARPGGNATGFALFEYGISGKWLELLKEIAPRVTRAAVLRDPAIASGIGQFAAIQGVAPAFGVEVSPVDVRDAGEIERDITAFARALEWRPDRDGERVGERSSRPDHRAGGPAPAARGLPLPLLRHRGGLISYGPDPSTVPARGRLCRPHPQGRETGRPAGAGADQVRTGDQPQDRQGARPRPCRRSCSPAPTR